jgi:DNA (cytosine-5)-methyltransferase 1
MSFNSAQRPFNPSSTHKVLELFAGVGGIRYGLEEANERLVPYGSVPSFEVVWANQWEPGCKKQNAARVYQARWGDAVVNRSLFDVVADPKEMARINALSPTMLVGGFPCQDYSVAKPASQSAGIEGKKGVLWWGIHTLLQHRISAGQPIELLLLENVDRLLASPAACPGRDFAVILASLQALGYAVAWQVVNAADYGFPQRRKRVFITAVHRSSPRYADWARVGNAPAEWLAGDSPLAKALPVTLEGNVAGFDVPGDPFAAQESYHPAASGRTKFGKVGVCVEGRVWTAVAKATPMSDFTPFTGHQAPLTLRDVVSSTSTVAPEYHLDPDQLAKWSYLKGRKSVDRVKADGHAYTYSEGAVAFPDPLDKPSRTIITSEGGAGASRTRHAVATSDGRLRRLTPEELEQLTGFRRGFTACEGLTSSQRAFLMGNALIPGLVARIGVALAGGPGL